MSGVIRGSPATATATFSSVQQSKAPLSRGYVSPLCSVRRTTLCSSYFNLKFPGFGGPRVPSRRSLRCSSSIRPGSPGSGDGDSRSVLDAFFLGKAVAEAINERVESAIGEILGAVGRLQAEQQKQVQEFQEEVLERAKRAKEKAAREAMEAQGLVPNSTVKETSVTNGVMSATSSIVNNVVTPANSDSQSDPTTPAVENGLDPADEDPVLGL